MGDRSSRHDSGFCPGSICMSDDTPNWEKNVIWYPGEPVCTRKPYCHIQRIQIRINKLLAKGKLKFPRTYWTANMLDRRTAVHPGTRGGNPERDHTPRQKVAKGKKERLATVGGINTPPRGIKLLVRHGSNKHGYK